MKYKFTPLFVIFLNLMITTNAYADIKDNDCARLHIQIGNASNTACQLISSKVIHGTLVSSPPAMIMAGFTERFDVTQTYRGPEIVLVYSCGGKRITVASQQNYCLLKAGDVSGRIIAADENIHATYTTENGSYYWGRPGLINWVLTTK